MLPHDYELREGPDHIDLPRVQSWLSASYWSPGIPLETVEKAVQNSSLVVSVQTGGEQVAYLRVVSDRATFGWIADVWVDEAHRGKGLARFMVRYALDHPDHQGLRRWILATRDAHDIYASCGFVPLPEPGRYMVKMNSA
jgi:GNAT superfamily N-acetyltransferase